MSKELKLSMGVAGMVQTISYYNLAFNASNDEKERQCLKFPWALSGSNNVLSIDLNPANTTSIANNKAGLDRIEYIIFDPTLGSADIAVTLPRSPMTAGLAAFRGAPCAVWPFINGQMYEPDANSKLDIEMADSWPTNGDCYVYGYVDAP